jgi:hypothetical protein
MYKNDCACNTQDVEAVRLTIQGTRMRARATHGVALLIVQIVRLVHVAHE